jgi:hypothetical protein
VAEEQTQDQQNQRGPLASTFTSVRTPLPAQRDSTPSTGSSTHVTNDRTPMHFATSSSSIERIVPNDTSMAIPGGPREAQTGSRSLFYDHPRRRSSNLEGPPSYDAAFRDRMNQYQSYSHPRARPEVQNEVQNAGPTAYMRSPVPIGEFHAGADSVRDNGRQNIDPTEPDPTDGRPFAWECWALRLLLQDRHGYNEGDLRAYLRAEYNEALSRKEARLAYMRGQYGHGHSMN